ncbi:MAG: AraC family transcriptional regulator [Pseudomonadales bacterium]|nr:AraC family transcriptional regulator [Pseudomonadales bacterium]
MANNLYLSKTYVQIALNLGFVTQEKAFENTGLTLDKLEKMDQIEFELAIRLLSNLNQYSSTPLWPTILGAHLSVTNHGPLGYATISAPTLGKAIATFVEWGQVRFACYTGEVVEQEDRMEVIIEDITGHPLFKRFFFECYIRAFEILITLIMGKPPKGYTEIYMERVADTVEIELRAAYDSTLVFGAECNKLVVPKELWYTRSVLYDKDSYELNIRKCQQLLDERNLEGRPDLAVKSAINKHFDRILNENLPPSPPPKLSLISEQLHMSERTLIRKLKSYNTAYAAILERERAELATRLLGEAKYTVFDVAELLGYRESANFCRAFKQWYGMSPTAYRRSH